MKTFNVKQIAEMLDTNPETVRRWIRTGKLKAEQPSRKEGNVVTEQMLEAFLKDTPKYAGIAAASSAFVASSGLLVSAVALISGIAVQQLGKSKEVQNAEVKTSEIVSMMEKNIKSRQEVIKKKSQALEQLQQEIEMEKQNISASESLIKRIQDIGKEQEDEGGIANE